MVREAHLQGNETVYDLGAGDARLLITAKRHHPGITAKGYEMIPTVWLFGLLRIWLSRKKVALHWKDALKADVSDADCIFLYLIPSLMGKLKIKFDKELRPGTKVLSYAFYFSGKDPVRTVPVPWLTGERKLWVYEW